MSCAVQLRSGDISCSVLFGKPNKTIPGKMGNILLFNDSQVVAYRIMQRKRERAFVFKAIKGDYKIPGVFPSVYLLAEATTKIRVKRLENIFKIINGFGLEPSVLDDSFYYFINYHIEKRLFKIDTIINKIKMKYV